MSNPNKNKPGSSNTKSDRGGSVIGRLRSDTTIGQKPKPNTPVPPKPTHNPHK